MCVLWTVTTRLRTRKVRCPHPLWIALAIRSSILPFKSAITRPIHPGGGFLKWESSVVKVFALQRSKMRKGLLEETWSSKVKDLARIGYVMASVGETTHQSRDILIKDGNSGIYFLPHKVIIIADWLFLHIINIGSTVVIQLSGIASWKSWRF